MPVRNSRRADWLSGLRYLSVLVSAVNVEVLARSDGFASISSDLNMDTASEVEPISFVAFVAKHHRTYLPGTAEYKLRRALFEDRAREAARHNSRPDRLWTWDAANRFADRTDAELAKLRAWRGPKHHSQSPTSFMERDVRFHSHDIGDKLRRRQCSVPDAMSWADLNATQSILDQGGCGSCSAMSTAVVLAAHHEIHHDRVRTFSPQELISCTLNPEACGGEGGCKGGYMELLMAYVLRHGLHEEHDFPSTSSFTGETGPCRTSTVDHLFVGTRPGVYSAAASGPSAGFGMLGYERLPTNRYEPVMRALLERGPLTVALSAKHWMFYDSGIFDRCEKDAIIDHAVVLLGFGHDDKSGRRFWRIQNSWGPDWGERGRLRLLRRPDEEEEAWCGQDSKPEFGAGCARNKDGSRKPMPLDPVEVCGTCGILFNPVVPHFEGESPESKRLAARRSDCAKSVAAPK